MLSREPSKGARLRNISTMVKLAMLSFTPRRAKLERSLTDRRVRLPQLDNLRWRVDVTISNRYKTILIAPTSYYKINTDMQFTTSSARTLHLNGADSL